MGDVARSDDMNPLELRPAREVFKGQVRAGRAGKVRVDVILAARGLLLVGLDVIGDNLTEVNVTSPTCFVEITEQTGFNVAGMFIDALEKEVAAPGRARA